MNFIRMTILFFGLAGCCSFNYAASVSTPTLPVTIDMPGENWQKVKLREVANLSPHAFSLLTGKKMNLTERIVFRLVKMKMKRALKKNPYMTTGEFFAAQKKMKTWLLVLLIVLGVFLLAFIIFAAAYGGLFS